MFFRCERCRTVYEVDSPVSAERMPTIGCQRCGHAFVAKPLRTLAPQGVIGGAAAEVRSSPTPLPPSGFSFRAPAEQSNTSTSVDDDSWQPPQPKNRRGLVLVVLAIVVVGALAVALEWPSTEQPAPFLSEQAATALSKGETLLWSDDEVSLEQAMALFAAAAKTDPDRVEPLAWLSLATTLLGETLACEVEDLSDEAQWLELQRRQIEQARPVDLDARLEAFDARQAAVGARLHVAAERSQRLLASGKASALAAWKVSDKPDELVPVRAVALFFANEGASSELETLLQPLSESQRADPWIHYARARVAKDVRQSLRKTAESKPRFERASWQLGRFALTSEPPDWDEANRRFAEVLARNNRHEGAARGLRRIEDLRHSLLGSADLATPH